MKNKRNNFICIGAVHKDYLLLLKKKYFKYRTNPISQKKSLGGVAYNIASKFAFLNQNVELLSINCDANIKNEIIKNNIKFTPLTRKIQDRSYTSILNSKKEMILGLANMDNYENLKFTINTKYQKNKNIIFDLNLSSKIIKLLINKYHKKNFICVCGTSPHKVYKVRNLLSKIDVLILNKQECFSLTKEKNIKNSFKYLIRHNDKLTIIISNGKYKVSAYNNNNIYSCKPPKVKIINENGAGDTMSAFFIYYNFLLKSFNDIFSKSVVAGSLQASAYHSKQKNYLQKINRISREIKITSKIYNG